MSVKAQFKSCMGLSLPLPEPGGDRPVGNREKTISGTSAHPPSHGTPTANSWVGAPMGEWGPWASTTHSREDHG